MLTIRLLKKDGILEELRSTLRAAVAALTALAFTLSPAGIARADDEGRPRVALLPVVPILKGAPEPIAADLAARLQRALSQSSELALVPLAEAAPAAAGPHASVPPFHGEGERAVARGEGLVLRAEKAARRLRFDEAARELLEGLDALTSAFDGLERVSAIGDADLQLAIVELRLGHRDDAERVLEDVVRLDPTRELSRGAYPAVFLRFFDQVRAKVLAQPKGVLHVASAARGAAVLVDGRSVGVTPLDFELPPGRHFVLVRSPGGQVAYRPEIPPGGDAWVGESGGRAVARAPAASGALPPAAKAVLDEVRANLLDGPGDEQLGGLARAAEADDVILAGVHGAGSQLAVDALLFSAATDQLVPLRRQLVQDSLADADARIAALVAEAAARVRQRRFADALTLPGPIAADFEGGAPALAERPAPTPPPVLAAAATPRPAPRPAKPAAATPAPPTPRDDSADEDEDVAEAGRIEVPAHKPKPKPVPTRSLDAELLSSPEKEEEPAASSSSGSTLEVVGLTVLAVVVVGAALTFGGIALFSPPSAGAPQVSWQK